MEAEFNKDEGIIIPDKEAFATKLKALMDGGIDNVQLITDFDQTLTRQNCNGEATSNSFTVLVNSEFVNDEFKTLSYESYKKLGTNITFRTLVWLRWEGTWYGIRRKIKNNARVEFQTY